MLDPPPLARPSLCDEASSSVALQSFDPTGVLWPDASVTDRRRSHGWDPGTLVQHRVGCWIGFDRAAFGKPGMCCDESLQL